MNPVRQWNPKEGSAFQGDVVIMPLPKGIKITSTEELEIAAIGKKPGDLVLAAGEATGHNHAIRYGLSEIAHFRDDGLARSLSAKAKIDQPGIAKLYRDDKALNALMSKGVLTTGELCIGFLRVEGNAPPLTHDEHDAIQIPAGEYYIGAKREFNMGEIQRVTD